MSPLGLHRPSSPSSIPSPPLAQLSQILKAVHLLHEAGRASTGVSPAARAPTAAAVAEEAPVPSVPASGDVPLRGEVRGHARAGRPLDDLRVLPVVMPFLHRDDVVFVRCVTPVVLQPRLVMAGPAHEAWVLEMLRRHRDLFLLTGMGVPDLGLLYPVQTLLVLLVLLLLVVVVLDSPLLLLQSLLVGQQLCLMIELLLSLHQDLLLLLMVLSLHHLLVRDPSCSRAGEGELVGAARGAPVIDEEEPFTFGPIRMPPWPFFDLDVTF